MAKEWQEVGGSLSQKCVERVVVTHSVMGATTPRRTSGNPDYPWDCAPRYLCRLLHYIHRPPGNFFASLQFIQLGGNTTFFDKKIAIVYFLKKEGKPSNGAKDWESLSGGSVPPAAGMGCTFIGGSGWGWGFGSRISLCSACTSSSSVARRVTVWGGGFLEGPPSHWPERTIEAPCM